MDSSLEIHEDRLFSINPRERDVSRKLYQEIKDFPIISPHGHTDPAWFADNIPFKNPTDLLIKPDHYLYRMLYSQGISLYELGIPKNGIDDGHIDPKQIWRTFAKHYYLFNGTPSRFWLDFVFNKIFGIEMQLDKNTADEYYSIINDALSNPKFLPRSLLDTFNIEVIATTESATDPLSHHQKINKTAYKGRVRTTFRPDAVVDPENDSFLDSLNELSEITDLDCTNYQDYIEALKIRRQEFKAQGATATDHGHSTAMTADLSDREASQLFKVVQQNPSKQDAELFRAHMLTKMAEMSVEDGLVMQIHPGSFRNHNAKVFQSYGRDKGADIPQSTNYVDALKPLLNRFGNCRELKIILFTLDESTYSRELAPLAGHYPCLKLGPAWWFHDSPEGMLRFRKMTTETAGFYNTVGFNDDTRALLSIPARHDMARRMDCVYLSELVCKHYFNYEDALEIAKNLTYQLPKQAYNL